MLEVRVAFIGAGALANQQHYPSVTEMKGARIVAICDLDARRLATTADRYEVEKRYSDYRTMLEQEEFEACYIIMPPAPLKAIALDCLAAGKHVFMEKPPGVRTEETIEMAEAAAKHGCLTAVGFNRRFANVVVKAKCAVFQQSAPSLVMAEFHKNMLGHGPYDNMSILHSDVIHVVDLMRDFCGEATEVVSQVEHRYEEWENSYNFYNALLRFDSGASGILTANRTGGNRYERFELHGRNISCYIRAPEQVEMYWAESREARILDDQFLTGTRDPRITYGYRDENIHFIECVRAEQQPITHLADAVKTMQLCDRIAEGAK
ncbi:MAG: Gfo/Idh/MocA family oxidoreductase [Abitibacteriaceae bacterium]|nr:Gfo/Idh/MocA family oxidoreductase [Abditibacteriaceae bacterium]MBV9868651.1 Gfo/Idh/MocA family oxidoreductase [Abditibacteriaceae bacterium]